LLLLQVQTQPGDQTVPESREALKNTYATALKVSAPVSEFFYSVETLDPADPDDKGYQRLVEVWHSSACQAAMNLHDPNSCGCNDPKLGSFA
jgi:hypothetical protein